MYIKFENGKQMIQRITCCKDDNIDRDESGDLKNLIHSNLNYFKNGIEIGNAYEFISKGNFIKILA
ncbi:hypothetical protein A3Q56_02070 [Intoshia linei]|uniref:Uncharacterized protein n=1 Tax=Intoshia linei TaxID=1819745 RepID=A0A177B965_9BILA|nr:hypothetical protein A3Q56_02070 [Intoshia linei]